MEDFLADYEQDVPAGTLWADCFDHCDYRHDEYEGENCTTTWEWWVTSRQENDELSTSKHWECIDDFGADPKSALAEERVRPILPVMPSVCGILGGDSGGFAGTFYWAAFSSRNGVPVANVREPIVVMVTSLPEDRIVSRTYGVVHELCHSAQEWHLVQQLRTDSRWPGGWVWGEWNLSPAGRSFIQLVGFHYDDDAQSWITPDRYRDVYSVNPKELSAELCVMYHDLRPPYHPYEDVHSYLTPEIVAWLEEWMILPDIETADDAAGGTPD